MLVYIAQFEVFLNLVKEQNIILNSVILVKHLQKKSFTARILLLRNTFGGNIDRNVDNSGNNKAALPDGI